MNQQQILELNGLYQSLIMAFDVQDLNDCAEKIQHILENENEYYDNIPENLLSSQSAEESREAIELLEQADAAIYDVLCAFEEYEISGFFAAVCGNNSELRAIFKENVQFAAGCVTEILRRDMQKQLEQRLKK